MSQFFRGVGGGAPKAPTPPAAPKPVERDEIDWSKKRAEITKKLGDTRYAKDSNVRTYGSSILTDRKEAEALVDDDG
jgi:hypothetical protein